MSKVIPSNRAASIRQKLLNYSKRERVDFQRVLDSYATECLLDRISRSGYSERLILKGALLFQIWSDSIFRPTRDIDFLGYGDNSVESMVQVFRSVASHYIDEDGMQFDPDSVVGEKIKEDDDYEGVRVLLTAYLGTARTRIQVDIGFGDAVTPEPEMNLFPRIFDLPGIAIRTYPAQTVIAEKFHAIALRGLLNSRMKDYYDLSILLASDPDYDSVRATIDHTFTRRNTIVPVSCPIELSDQFATDREKNLQWNGFLKRTRIESGTLGDAVQIIRDALSDILGWG